MSGKLNFQVESPKTQSIDSVKALLAWKGHPFNPLPTDVSLDNGRLMLVLNNKKDAYYVTTPRTCSCPSATYRPGQTCKHQRKYFPEAAKATKPTVGDSIKPVMLAFRPISPLPGEVRKSAEAAAPSPPLYIDMHDTSDKDAAYWSIREDREMWPAEA
jgi:hypothetical protein